MVLWIWWGSAGWFWLVVPPEVTVRWQLMLESSNGSPGLDVQDGWRMVRHLSCCMASPCGWLSFLIAWWTQASWISYMVPGSIQGKHSKGPRLKPWKSHDPALEVTCCHFGPVSTGRCVYWFRGRAFLDTSYHGSSTESWRSQGLQLLWHGWESGSAQEAWVKC